LLRLLSLLPILLIKLFDSIRKACSAFLQAAFVGPTDFIVGIFPDVPVFREEMGSFFKSGLKAFFLDGKSIFSFLFSGENIALEMSYSF